MNAKNKIVALVMSFVICFGTVSNSFANDKEQLNYDIKPLVVDGGVISVPILATVSALAVGTGIVLKNSDDIYDIGRMFYDYIQSHNEMTWDFVQTAFAVGHTVIDNYVQVDSNFLDIVKGFFDNTFEETNADIVNIGAYPIYPDTWVDVSKKTVEFPGLKIEYLKNSSGNYYHNVSTRKYLINSFMGASGSTPIDFVSFVINGTWSDSKGKYCDLTMYSKIAGKIYERKFVSVAISDAAYHFPYYKGYEWGKAEDKKVNDSISLPIPSDLGKLVGQTSDDFWTNDKDLAGSNPITRPSVENPSIDVTDDVFVGGSTSNPSIPSNPSVPNEGLFANIKDFIISLVVPSDSFWTDTFNGFRDNFSKNFPMLDMSKFDSLAVGGKPFPNLYAYGSKIVDGDVINSIVDWLRPIIAGFIMICLMFFNYRKIYKLIRNTEPFGGVAQGSSDFRTGLSAPPINNGLDSNPLGNLRDTLFDMRNEILRRENNK